MDEDPDAREVALIWMGLCAIFLIVALALGVGCGAPRPGVVTVRVASWPGAPGEATRAQIGKDCDLPGFPNAPQAPEWKGFVAPDEFVTGGITKYYVTARQIEAALEWTNMWVEHDKEVKEWSDAARRCMVELAESIGAVSR